MKRVLLILSIAIIGFFTLKATPPKQAEISKEATSSATVRVTKVIDGDTIEIEGGERVRYIGLDTPEIETGACYGKEAMTENKTLVEGKAVRLVKDTSESDSYNRLLRYVWVGDTFVNDILIRRGYARVEPVRPDLRYASEFYAAQEEAKRNSGGLWSACPTR